ncbi:ferredoxin--NADP reductase [Nocardia donostiensis]|uniref:3-ketosteroid-9-alpha-hydroxylase n=1 Tax=Nocardia donostiensis TaxID=1538463 RepID=A0A1V2TB25_9NOCA|nr:ferredoxin--NADP reductase [Nocardia donostiensis]ONM46658.1 3-ketosteroid-9-alpha-hydroxylase [Nocardia donostiensis]OQS12739.1 3-ketosteroid-9-alpha-hydroxylase [Nocardia donostiensis]OQS19281.1 3-ketosteroid-9-alpha-hydroxylase [Nocardia donostiensis]
MASADARRSSRSLLLRVSEVIEETAEARSLVFDVPADAADRFSYRPGQFLTLRVPSEQTGSVARCYSLASSPVAGHRPKVTVKRTRDGYASNWLCDNIAVGDAIEVLPPAGTFTPTSLDHDFLLWAAGSGITPVMSILESALAAGSGQVTLCYANRDESAVIFADRLRELAARYPARLTIVHWLESLQGLPTAAQLAVFAAPFTGYESFLCGPAPFMDAVRAALTEVGVPRERIHAEVFSSLSGDPFQEPEADLAGLADTDSDPADAADVAVELDGAVHQLRWPRDRTLVDVMLARGLDVPYSCREGECGSCACTVLRGEVAMDNAGILDPEDIDAGYILGCQARPLTDELEIRF